MNSIFGRTRRALMKFRLGMAASGVAASSLVARVSGQAEASEKFRVLNMAPKYYPRRWLRPQLVLSGKLAVVTGASRGMGRAVGEALAALGVDVIGTSRKPDGVSDRPAFPLLALDVADPASVVGFVGELSAHPSFTKHGQVDILVNNAGRFVVGRIVPLSPDDFFFFLAQRDLAVRTIYSGHVTVTSALLPLMARQGYARIMFTTSIAAYHTGATLDGGSLFDLYNSSKHALRGYANNLGTAMKFAGSNIRVSTVNPYLVNTKIVEHPSPIYTLPVDSSGLSEADPLFSQGMIVFRQLVANGLPPSFVGEAYAQLLQSLEPEPNVVVASPVEPLATMGGNAIFEPQIIAENGISAVPLTCG